MSNKMGRIIRFVILAALIALAMHLLFIGMIASSDATVIVPWWVDFLFAAGALVTTFRLTTR